MYLFSYYTCNVTLSSAPGKLNDCTVDYTRVDGSLGLLTLQGNMADVEKAVDEQNFHEENDVEEQMDVDQEPELDK